MNKNLQSDFHKKILGCWYGKAVGGTLGGPIEGETGPHSLTFYDPIPNEMLPNDDLDLQVAWLEQICRSGFPINCRDLADAWIDGVHFYPDEYGVAVRNIERQLYPPISGSYDNFFIAGMGAAIRTELWACLAPGNPDLAVHFATQDACVDHAGEGLYAAQFLAAVESMAFVENDSNKLIDAGLEYIPEDCRVATAIQTARKTWLETADWLKTREVILAKHGEQNWTDVAPNLAFIVLGWIAGKDFGDSICIAVNCGLDSDCTGATLGALLGIIAPESIGERWIEPIGNDMVLSAGMCGQHHAKNLNVFTEQIINLKEEVAKFYKDGIPSLPESETESLVCLKPLQCVINYHKATTFFPGIPSEINIKFTNTSKTDAIADFSFSVPYDWQIEQSTFKNVSIPVGNCHEMLLKITAPDNGICNYKNTLNANITLNGMEWHITAGLPQSIPWLRNGLPAPQCGGTLPLPKGKTEYTVDVKIPGKGIYRIISNASRFVKLFVDGEKEADGDTGQIGHIVPAIHRSTGIQADVLLTRGWHTIKIVSPAGTPGKIYLTLGDAPTWKLHSDLEWKETEK